MRTHRKTTRITTTLLEEFQATLNGAPFTHKAYAAWLEQRCQHQRTQLRHTDDLLAQATNRANNTENILGARLQTASQRAQALIDHLVAYSGYTGDEAIIQDLQAALPKIRQETP